MQKVIIIGNPNTGKTTLFNTLTKSHEKVANYSGVTVTAREKCIKHKSGELTIVDLPGFYSTQSNGADEKVSIDYLRQNKDAKIIYVATTLDIEKNLLLFTELVNSGFNVSLFINELGQKFDNATIKKLEQKLPTPIYYGDARGRRKSILSWIVDKVLNQSSVSKFVVGYNELTKLLNVDPIRLQKLDKILLHPIFGKILFVIVMAWVYFISFSSVGASLSQITFAYWQKFWELVIFELGKFETYLLIDFLQVVLIDGVGSVVAFLPQLFLMLFCMYLLEESGYLPRVAYLFNVNLNKIGLNGKSIFGMAVGMGCTTSGFLATRNIDDNECRKRTSMFLPFIGCSAKLPIVLYLANLLIANQLLILFMIFVLVLGSGIAYLKVSTKITPTPFIMELPRLNLPSLKRLTYQSFEILKDFVKRVTVIILIITSIVWGLQTVEININGNQSSLLDIIAMIIGAFFKPIGLDAKPLVLSLLTGLVAKENIISIVSIFDGVRGLALNSLISFILFIMLYSPCIPALRCARSEFGKRFALKIFLVQTGLAYGVSFVYYTFATAFGLVVGFSVSILFILLAITFCRTLNKKQCFKCEKCIT